jgi:hypothetical protein
MTVLNVIDYWTMEPGPLVTQEPRQCVMLGPVEMDVNEMFWSRPGRLHVMRPSSIIRTYAPRAYYEPIEDEL